jgi:hypothetical protein
MRSKVTTGAPLQRNVSSVRNIISHSDSLLSHYQKIMITGKLAHLPSTVLAYVDEAGHASTSLQSSTAIASPAPTIDEMMELFSTFTNDRKTSLYQSTILPFKVQFILPSQNGLTYHVTVTDIIIYVIQFLTNIQFTIIVITAPGANLPLLNVGATPTHFVNGKCY